MGAPQVAPTPKMQVPFNVNINLEGKDDLLYHLITQEINLMRGNIERALRDEMNMEIENQKIELYASFKMELLEAKQKDITSPVKKLNLRAQG